MESMSGRGPGGYGHGYSQPEFQSHEKKFHQPAFDFRNENPFITNLVDNRWINVGLEAGQGRSKKDHHRRCSFKGKGGQWGLGILGKGPFFALLWW